MIQYLVLFSEYLSANGEAQKTTNPPQQQSPAPNGRYPSQGRGENLAPPPRVAVTRPPAPRGPDMPGHASGVPRGQPRMPMGPPR